jgi:hypothetical protein
MTASSAYGEATAVTQGSVGVWLSIARLARREQAAVSVRHAVSACAQAAGAAAALSLSPGGGMSEPLYATDARSDELEELQGTLGQGPSLDALTGNELVLAGDLAAAPAQARWPQFAPAALSRGVAAIFSFPVRSGAARVGVLTLYRDGAGQLTPSELDTTLLYADAILMLALDERGGLAPGAVELVGRGFTGRRAEIHQAAGMISVQLHASVTDALVALRARAFAESRPISDVAADVIARRLSFAPLGTEVPGEMPPGPHR